MGFSRGNDSGSVRQLVETIKGKVVKVLASDPDPLNYTIEEEMAIGECVVVTILYPDCKNYEGKKILLFTDKYAWNDLKKSKKIDPHFIEEKCSPMARFEPTERGKMMAVATAQLFEKICESKNQNVKT